MTLNPDGILSLGLNIGRRSVDLVLIDVTGIVRGQLKKTYAYPTPEVVMQFLTEGMSTITGNLTKKQLGSIAGIGVAAPFELWNWLDTVKAPKDAMQLWRGFDLQSAVENKTGLPVVVQNDTTSACTAEHIFGRGREFADYAYFFIGSFIGGGVVLNDTVYSGRTGNAGAFGTIPVRFDISESSQLIHNASIYLLEKQLEARGEDSSVIWKPDHNWEGFEDILSDWIDQTAKHLAVAVVAVSSVIDFQRILVDANCPQPIRERIVERTCLEVRKLDTQGIADPIVLEASVGRNARAIGAASLPVIERYFLSQPSFT
jgi:predicted NBD/HSP70 family sugar kinase